MSSQRHLKRQVQKWKRRTFTSNFFLVLVGIFVVGGGIAVAASTIAELNDGDTISVQSGDGCIIRQINTSKENPWRRRFSCTLRSTTSTSTSSTSTSTSTSTSSTTTTTTTTSPPTPDQPPTVVTNGTTWKSIFADEFSGTTVDTSKWNVQNNSTFGEGNNEEQRYMAGNTEVANGTLRLVGKQEATSGKAYTSGMVTTRAQGGTQKFAFKQGYTEVRARLPKGGGYWPAFWLVGANGTPGWPAYGEIDVFEGYGTYPNMVEATYHWSDNGSHKQQGGQSINVGSNLDWHTYGVYWTANRLQFIIDGVVRQTFNATTAGALAGLGYDHTIILNLAIGGNGPRQYHGWNGQWATGDLPGIYEIDYVRVFQP